MTRHTEDTLRGAGISQVFNLALAVAAAEAIGTEGLVARQDGQVLDFVAAVVAAICAVVAYQRAVTEEEQVGVRVEQGAACVAAEAVDMPSVPSWSSLVWCSDVYRCVRGESARGHVLPSSKAFPSSRIWIDGQRRRS
jgi:hypothetical protein